jgi:hypothetical protein
MAGNPSQLAGPFSDAARVAFNLYIADPINRNRFYISESDYVMLTDFYLNPTKSAKTAKADDLKYRSKTEFVLKEGRLCKRIGDGDLWYVVRPNEVFDIITSAHCSNQHPGIDKTYKNIRGHYIRIVRSVIAWLLAYCFTCASKPVSKTHAPFLPLVVNNLFERVQIDLIDMRGDSDGDFKWICYLRDNFSKYSIAEPLRTKSSDGVTSVVVT